MNLLNQILHPRNMTKARERVIANKGGAGVDGMQVSELTEWLQVNQTVLIASIRNGTYMPSKVLGVEIDKRSGGKRLLGIPTVIDRTIQQAIQQVLSPMYERDFSAYSYGFRPNRGAHQGISQALTYINSGYQDIIDLDLKSFFDVVNHDLLMSILYRKVKDERLLRLIRKYLKTGILIGGLEQPREQGTPQGSPLSPLLSNILLNELDQELGNRGLRFIRYADDCSIFLKSKRSARRVLKGVSAFIEGKLKLKVNTAKTSICRPISFHLLGYNFISTYKRGEVGKYRLRVSPARFNLMKKKVKAITRKTRPLSFDQRLKELNSYLKGWLGYFRYANMQNKLKELDVWIRCRLRYCIWKHWKKPNKRMRSYIRMGLDAGLAYAWSRSRMGGWAQACSPIMKTTVTIARLKRRGYIEFYDYFQRFNHKGNYKLDFEFIY
jgi:group II intron reverse transcriptase/maturase